MFSSMSNSRIAVLLCISILLLPFLAFSFSSDAPESRRVLVLLDDLSLRSSHSLFFNSLKSRGYEVQFKLHDDPSLALHRYGRYLYDALVIFSPLADRFGGNVDQAAVLEFVDSGHDLIIAADGSASDFIKGIANECGVDFDEDPSSRVIDHLNYAVSSSSGDHTLIAADSFIKSNALLGSGKIEAPVLFKGIALSVNLANKLVLPVLSASPSAYSANPNTKTTSPPKLTGSQISLVAVVQARNNARILVSGSIDMFGNRFLRSDVQKSGNPHKFEKSGNEQFLTEIGKWVFHERGHLKIGNMQHHKAGEKPEPSMYRIKDDLEFSVEILEWSGEKWLPYVADDVQVQFYMMSPYVLKTLSTDGKGTYFTSLKVPDVYGVFQFKVEYNKLGYTSLSLSKQIPVRPFRHNEYERFITTAYPYYSSSFSMMAGFFIFSIIFLYHK